MTTMSCCGRTAVRVVASQVYILYSRNSFTGPGGSSALGMLMELGIPFISYVSGLAS